MLNYGHVFFRWSSYRHSLVCFQTTGCFAGMILSSRRPSRMRPDTRTWVSPRVKKSRPFACHKQERLGLHTLLYQFLFNNKERKKERQKEIIVFTSLNNESNGYISLAKLLWTAWKEYEFNFHNINHFQQMLFHGPLYTINRLKLDLHL